MSNDVTENPCPPPEPNVQLPLSLAYRPHQDCHCAVTWAKMFMFDPKTWSWSSSTAAVPDENENWLGAANNSGATLTCPADSVDTDSNDNLNIAQKAPVDSLSNFASLLDTLPPVAKSFKRSINQTVNALSLSLDTVNNPCNNANGSRDTASPIIPFVGDPFGAQNQSDRRSARKSLRKYSALGTINPDLYKAGEEGDNLEFPDNHSGRVWFSVQYDKPAEKLIVELLKICNLPFRNPSLMSPIDPFVRLYLSPDERNYAQSKTKKKSCNPRFDETFYFNVSEESIVDRPLKFIVYDVDPFKRDTPIGHLVFNLADFMTSGQAKLTTFRDLEKGLDSPDNPLIGANGETPAELCLTLCYNETLDQLTVSIVEARNVRMVSPRDKDTYAKVTCSWLGASKDKSKKTKIIRKSSSPIYNESFMFRVPKEKLDVASVSIQLKQARGDYALGRVVVGGQMCTKGNALTHWNRMIETPGDVVSDWHYFSEH